MLRFVVYLTVLLSIYAIHTDFGGKSVKDSKKRVKVLSKERIVSPNANAKLKEKKYNVWKAREHMKGKAIKVIVILFIYAKL